MTDNRLVAFISGAGVCAVLLAYPLYFIPLTIYLGNSDEFSISFFSILRTYAPLAVVSAGLVGLISMLMSTAWRNTFLKLLLASSLLFWIQGNLLVWHYGLLDGREIDWSQNSWQGWLDISVWIIILGTALFFLNRLTLRKIALTLFAVQLCVSLFSIFSYERESKTQTHSENYAELQENIYSFSKTQNVVQIIADGFQSDIFEEILSEGERGRRLAEAMDGFRFFRDHLGAFPFTHMSMPAILSGKIYKNHIPIQEHMDDAVGGVTSISAAYDSGYEVDIVTPGGLLHTMYEKLPSTNFYSVPRTQHLSQRSIETFEAAKLLDLSLFRLAPHFLKKYVYNDQLWLVQTFMTDKKYMSLAFFRHIAFLDNLSANMKVTRDKPVYKYLHLTLSHNPMVTGEDCSYAGQVLVTVRPTVKFQAGCALEKMITLIESMKKHGVYDDALIVFMADHGVFVAPTGLHGPISADKKAMEVLDPRLVALAMPLFAIKRPGDSGPIKFSNAPTSVIDSAKTITDVLALDANATGRNVYNINETEERKRNFYFYENAKDEWGSDFLAPITEVIVDGPVIDRASWKVTKTYLPNNVIESENPIPLPAYNIKYK